MNKSLKNSTRKSSIELLRVLTMIGVVVLHYNNKSMGGGLAHVVEGSVNQYYLLFTDCLFIGAVNLFIMISAYFLSVSQKRSFVKIVELLFQVSLYRVALYLLMVCLKAETFSVLSLFKTILPLNYFVILYSAVYLISPYINILLNRLSEKTFRKLIITSFGLFSFWTIFGVFAKVLLEVIFQASVQ